MLEGNEIVSSVPDSEPFVEPRMTPTLNTGGVPQIAPSIGLTVPYMHGWGTDNGQRMNSFADQIGGNIPGKNSYGQDDYGATGGLNEAMQSLNVSSYRHSELEGHRHFNSHINHSSENTMSMMSVPHSVDNGHESEMHHLSGNGVYSRPEMTTGHEWTGGYHEDYMHSSAGNMSYAQVGNGNALEGDIQDAMFAMFQFKVEKCTKQFVHDWKECPFAHEGETARRRHPSQHSSQPCAEFKTNKSCPRGNMCPLAHGPWEAGLHPDAFRTNLCAYGRECKRRMCFFAHDISELRQPTSHQHNLAVGQSRPPTAGLDSMGRNASLNPSASSIENQSLKRSGAVVGRGGIQQLSTRSPEPAPRGREAVGGNGMVTAPSPGFFDAVQPMDGDSVSLFARQQGPGVIGRQRASPEPWAVPNGVSSSTPLTSSSAEAIVSGRTSPSAGKMNGKAPSVQGGKSTNQKTAGPAAAMTEVKAASQNSQRVQGKEISPVASQIRAQATPGRLENLQDGAGMAADGARSGDKAVGRRNLQVSIPMQNRFPAAPTASSTTPMSSNGSEGKPTFNLPTAPDSLIKQDISWVDQLLDSPIEPGQRRGAPPTGVRRPDGFPAPSGLRGRQ